MLFIIDSLTCGGAEKSLVSLLPLLSREKYEFSLWMRHPGGDFVSLVPKDVSIVNDPEYSAFEKFKFFVGRITYSLVLRMLRLINKKEHGAETLYKCQGWAMKVPKGQWDVVIAYQQGVPTYLVADHFTGAKKLAWVNADIFKAGYNPEFNKRFYDKIDYICPVSDLLHAIMNERMPMFGEKYRTIWDVINPNVTRQLAKESAPRLKTSEDEYVFVTTGRLGPPKGYDIAVETAFELKRKGLNFKWYFIGEGPERPKIERMIKTYEVIENVILLGLQTNPYKFMVQADVYIQTSKSEGFGMTIGEAKILGLPVVSTNFDVVYNQISNEQNGLIAEMNGKSVANAICRMITDSALRKSIIKKIKKENNTTYLTEAEKVEEMFDA